VNWLIEQRAEAAIAKALEEGNLSGLAGEGKPLELEDWSGVPETLRLAYKVLKNAGMLPPALENRRELLSLERMLAEVAPDAPLRPAALSRLRWLQQRLAAAGYPHLAERLSETRQRQLLRALAERRTEGQG